MGDGASGDDEQVIVMNMMKLHWIDDFFTKIFGDALECIIN